MTGPAEAFRRNFDLYNRPQEVAHWASLSDLQPPEAAILSLLGGRLSKSDMLDVGVGGGRSTRHFAPRVKSYLGGDLTPSMVDACRRGFPNLAFEVCDASKPLPYSDGSFDFVLFSYNGLDYLDSSGRATALREFWRVLRPGGYLAFSSHNLNFFPALRRRRRPAWAFHPRRLAGGIQRWLRFVIHNRHVRSSPAVTEATVFEGQLGWKAPTFYIRPDRQLALLQEQGWEEIRLFPNEGGTVPAIAR